MTVVGVDAPLLKKPQSFKKARGTPHPRVLREQLAADIDKPRAYYYWKIVGSEWPRIRREIFEKIGPRVKS